jgi:hypothetical protein
MPPAPVHRQPQQPSAPSSEVRTLVSLLLFIHLFCVAIALSAYAAPSALQERIRTFFAPYLATFDFDVNTNAYPTGRFYLTHDREEEVDAVIHVEGTLPDGTTQSLTIPEPGLWPPERRRHFQSLANVASALVEDEERQAVLPRAIAGSLLGSWGATNGSLRIERHLSQAMEEIGSNDPDRRNPLSTRHYRTAYDARVLVSPDGRVELIKKVAAGEVAPVDKKPVDKQPGGAAPGDKPGER